jgi:hypothetical protein
MVDVDRSTSIQEFSHVEGALSMHSPPCLRESTSKTFTTIFHTPTIDFVESCRQEKEVARLLGRKN